MAGVMVRTAVVLLLAVASSGLLAQPPARLPFAPGERATYQVRVAKMGARGHGSMWVDGPEVVRGVQTYVLHFDSEAGVGPFKAGDRTTSWLDAQRMTSLRFTKREHHLFSHHDDDVEIYPTQRRWEAGAAGKGESPTDAPLDELSFLYFVRTLPLDDDSLHLFVRHYDPDRNPVSLRAVGKEAIEAGGVTFSTVIVEMRVRDPRHYRGEGVLRINLSDDERRILVRIESVMPEYGKTVLTLDTYSAAPEASVARAR